jgi:tRNA uridine 5-carboxymethylaminomethyl modification enzyme
LEEILRRPDVGWRELCEISPELSELRISPRAQEQIAIETKYAGYIRRQTAEIERQSRIEAVRIPETFDFHGVPQLRREAKDRLSTVRPRNLGQAGRISGITPADLAILMLYLKEPQRMAS